jgi:hypothetical protein
MAPARVLAAAPRVALALVFASTTLPAAAPLTPDLRSLLTASDPFAAAPEEARVELAFEAANGARVPLEIWRRGDERALVRFLAAKDLGKFVLRRGNDVWLLAPGARDPVKMSPALAPAGGAALDELLALRLGRDYRAIAAEEKNDVVTFDLEGTRPGVEPPRLRWVVDRARRRPLRAEFRDAEGTVRRLVEFKAWREGARLEPAEVVAKDVVRGGRPLVVHIFAIEKRAVPDALFDLADATARNALPPPPSPAP